MITTFMAAPKTQPDAARKGSVRRLEAGQSPTSSVVVRAGMGPSGLILCGRARWVITHIQMKASTARIISTRVRTGKRRDERTGDTQTP
jgi:hypothetical protein